MKFLPKLYPEQRVALHKIIASVNEKESRIFCLNASEGTRKPYVINIIFDSIQSNKQQKDGTCNRMS